MDDAEELALAGRAVAPALLDADPPPVGKDEG
jgi:hypothetical protein